MKSLLSLSFVLVACGGIVNYSPDGGEGGSGALGGGGAGPGPNTTTNNMTNAQSMDVVTTGPGNTCDLFCAQFEQCFEGQCFELCSSIYAPGCEGQAEAYLQCLIDVNPQNCAFDAGLCPEQEAAYNECLNGSSCFTEECGQGSDGTCDCFGECFGTKVEQYCVPGSTGTSSSVGATTGGAPEPPQDLFCNCYLGGDYVGDCTSSSCTLEDGCCQQYLNVDG